MLASSDLETVTEEKYDTYNIFKKSQFLPPQPKGTSIFLAVESTKPVCQPEMQKVSSNEPRKQATGSLGCGQQRCWAQAAP